VLHDAETHLAADDSTAAAERVALHADFDAGGERARYRPHGLLTDYTEGITHLPALAFSAASLVE
jgi:hypothetical protein